MQVRQVLQEPLVLMAPQGRLAHKVLQVRQVLLALQALKAILARQVLPAQQVRQVQQARLVLPGLMVLLVLPALQALRVHPALVALYASCAGESALPLIERAEAWLPSHARDAVLLLTLGKLCTRQALWGKAQGYLEASLSLQPTPEAHRALADLLERLGKTQEAGRHLRKSAELAG